MELCAYEFCSGKEIICQYDRTLLDMAWLEKILQGCTPGSPAYVHYSAQIKKERDRFNKLEELMAKKNLFQ